MLFRLFLSLWIAYVNAACSSSREFIVENCTACPIFDQTRHGNIQMAVCEERVVDTGYNMAYACMCRNFPTQGFLVSAMLYFPQTEGNVTRCSASWETAPGLYTLFAMVSAGVTLYAAAHFFYIVLRSRMCCCSRHAYTNGNVGAFFCGVAALFWSGVPLWRIVTQGEIAIGTGSHAWLGHGLDVLLLGGIFGQSIGFCLIITSIFNVAYHGEDKARLRCYMTIFYCVIFGTYALSYVVLVVVRIVHPNFGQIYIVPLLATVLIFLLQLIPVPVAHRTMRKVSLSVHVAWLVYPPGHHPGQCLGLG